RGRPRRDRTRADFHSSEFRSSEFRVLSNSEPGTWNSELQLSDAYRRVHSDSNDRSRRQIDVLPFRSRNCAAGANYRTEDGTFRAAENAADDRACTRAD